MAAAIVAILMLLTPAEADALPRSSSGKGGAATTKSRPAAQVTSAVKRQCSCPKRVVRKRTPNRRPLSAMGREQRALRTFAKQRALLRAGYLAGIRGNAQRPRLLDGWQIRLIDGDTFAYAGERIRIRGYNAPEVSEAGGFAASQRLDLLLREGPVTIIPEATDVYGRTVADVFVNQRNVADVMSSEGYAKK
jgi:endonuclease YncB( thermonuclease family)